MHTKDDFYISKYFAALPFIFFVIIALVLGVNGLLTTELMPAIVVVGWILGSFFAKNKPNYWDSIINGMSDRSIGLVGLIFFIVGIYSKIMAKGKVAEGLIFLGSTMNLTGGMACAFAYLISLVFGIASGSALGTIFAMVPVLYPAAVGLGGAPLFVAGAILSGGATGDHFAPVSDTTIISASTQKFRNKKSESGEAIFADLAGVVRSRFVYVVPAAIITFVLYLIFGGNSGSSVISNETLLSDFSYAPGLIMLIPIVIVITFAVKGKTIFESLTWGIIVGTVLGLGSGILSIQDFFYIADGSVKGIIVEGVTGTFSTLISMIALMGSINLMKEYGIFDDILGVITEIAGTTPRRIELLMFGIATLNSFLLTGATTRTTVVTGPLNDEIGSIAKIHPYRRANITDAVACSLAYIVPWHRWPLYVIGSIKPLLDSYPFLPVPQITDFWRSFYGIVIWIIMLIAVLTGFGRQFEGKDGEVVKGKLFDNTIPEDVL